MKLDGAYPRTPDAFCRMVDSTLDSLPIENTSSTSARHIPRGRALLIAALAALTLIGGIALAAAHMGLIDMLFYGKTPSSVAVDSVKTISAADSQAGYSLCAQQYLIDGDKLHLCMDMGAPTDTYTLAFMNISTDAGHFILANAPDEYSIAALGGEFGSQRQFYAQLIFDAMPQEPFFVNVEAYYLEPLLPIKTYAADDENEAMLEDGVWPKAANDRIYVSQEGGGRFFPTMRADFNEADGVLDYSGEGAVKLLESAGIARKSMRLSVSFCVDPYASAGVLRALGTPLSVDFSEYTFTIRRADFGVASAVLLFEVHPKRAMAELDMQNDDPLYRWYEPRMADGTPIGISSGGGYGTERDADGNVYLDYEMRLSGISELPNEITLVPYRSDGNDKRVYFEDEAVKIPLADTSK